jgi:hypothetical protein
MAAMLFAGGRAAQANDGRYLFNVYESHHMRIRCFNAHARIAYRGDLVDDFAIGMLS